MNNMMTGQGGYSSVLSNRMGGLGGLFGGMSNQQSQPTQQQQLQQAPQAQQGQMQMGGMGNYGDYGGFGQMGGFNPMMGGFGGYGGFNPMMGGFGGYGGFNPMMGGFGGGYGQQFGGFNPMMGGGFNPMMSMGLGAFGGGFNPMMGSYGMQGGMGRYDSGFQPEMPFGGQFGGRIGPTGPHGGYDMHGRKMGQPPQAQAQQSNQQQQIELKALRDLAEQNNIYGRSRAAIGIEDNTAADIDYFKNQLQQKNIDFGDSALSSFRKKYEDEYAQMNQPNTPPAPPQQIPGVRGLEGFNQLGGFGQQQQQQQAYQRQMMDNLAYLTGGRFNPQLSGDFNRQLTDPAYRMAALSGQAYSSPDFSGQRAIQEGLMNRERLMNMYGLG